MNNMMGPSVANAADGPVARVRLPERICSGTHAYWADATTLNAG